ncbi:hypothetical protein BLM14_04095 [Phyllobacterium zundukense]|nr:hypothetical protein BLM14_04095 [Phyllobacterium zundukense]
MAPIIRAPIGPSGRNSVRANMRRFAAFVDLCVRHLAMPARRAPGIFASLALENVAIRIGRVAAGADSRVGQIGQIGQVAPVNRTDPRNRACARSNMRPYVPAVATRFNLSAMPARLAMQVIG